MMQNEPILQPHQKRLIILGIAVVCVGLLIYYVSTHGRLSLKNLDSKDISISRLTKNGTTEAPARTYNGAILATGDYVVRNDSDGLPRIAYITIPGWFQAGSITLKSVKNADIERGAALTYENFFRADSGDLVSVTNLLDIGAGYTIHPASDAFGGNYTDVPFGSQILSSPSITSEGSLIGINGSSLQKYSFTSKSSSNLLSVPIKGDGDTDTDFTQRSNSISDPINLLYSSSSHELYLVNTKTGTSEKEILPDISNRGNTVVDANKSYYAVIDSRAIVGTKEDSGEDTASSFRVELFAIPSNKKISVNIGNAKTVSVIAISPSGRYIAAIKDGNVWVYDTTTSHIVMTNPYQMTNQLLWSGDALYTISVDSIAVFDISTKQITPLKTPSTLKISKVTPIGSVLYVSAFSTLQDSKLPDGYVIDLNKQGDDITQKLAEKLPYTGKGYDINYLGKTIYIRATSYGESDNQVIQKLQEEARAKLGELIDPTTLKKCQITYVD
jgi:hypothetical protein